MTHLRSLSLSRRRFLSLSAVLAATSSLGLVLGAEGGPAPQLLTFGVFADAQYGEVPNGLNRAYREGAARLAACIQTMIEAKPAFVIGLGDFVDGRMSFDADTGHLKRIEGIFRRFPGPRYHVLGNHDLDQFTKEQFCKATDTPAPHYGFDAGPFRCVVLDACYREDLTAYRAGDFLWTDSWIPPEEQKWLEAELKKTDRKALVFVHQPLDDEEGAHGVRNAPDVRRILEESRKVVAVFQGHNHRGGYRKIRAIPYFTMCGMVEGNGPENNAYALVTVSPTGAIRIKGFGAQPSRTME